MKKLLILTTALVAFGAEPAHAGPVVGWLAVNVFSAVTASTALGLALARLTVGIALSVIGSAIQKAMMPSPKISVKTELDIGDDTPLSFTVGSYVTAGKRKYAGSWGRNTRFITDVVEVSCLPQGLAGLWVDDEAGEWATGSEAHAFATASESPSAKGSFELSASETPAPGKIYMGRCLKNKAHDEDGGQPRLCVRFYDGTQTEADPFLLWAFGSDPDYPWTADHIGTGKSYVIITARYDDEVLTGYPTFLWELDPLPMYDPRKDSTNGGSGAHRWGDRATYEPSRNPAVIAYNLARGIYYGDEWIFGGRNLAAWRLPVAEWFAAMNAADATVALSAGGTEPAYRCGAEITVDMEPAGVLEEIGRAANMRFAEVGGLLKPQIEIPSASVLAITDDDIIITEGQSYQPFSPIGDTYNALSATYPEPVEKWASKDAPEYVDADATAEDGQWVPDDTGALVWVPRYLPTSISYGAAPYPLQVQRLMRTQMRDFRRARRHQFQLPPMAYALEPLVDKITWTSARNGYVAKEFVVEEVQKLPGMCVAVTLREADAGDYDWSSDYELPYTTITPVNPTTIAQTIRSFTAVGAMLQDDAGSNRRAAILVSCASGEVGISSVHIQMRRVGATMPEVDIIRPYADPYQWTITDVVGGVAYQVRGMFMVPGGEWTDWITVSAPSLPTESSMSAWGGVDNGPGGFDNTAVFNAAVDAIVERGGGRLTVDPGEFGQGYYFNGPIRVNGCAHIDFQAPVWFGPNARLCIQGHLVEEQELPGSTGYALLRATSGAGTAYPNRVYLSNASGSNAANYSVGDYIVIRGQEDASDVSIEREEAFVAGVVSGSGVDLSTNYLVLDRNLAYTYQPEYPASEKPGGNDRSTVGRFVASKLAADAAAGDTSITVANGSRFAAGQWLHLEDEVVTDRYSMDTNSIITSSNLQHAQDMQIQSVAGNVLHLTEPLPQPLIVAKNAIAIRLDPVIGARITGARIRFTGYTDALDRYILWLHYCMHSTIEDCSIYTEPGQTAVGLRRQAIRVDEGCQGNTVTNCRIEHSTSYDGGDGYGVILLKGARGNFVTNCFARGMRHSFIEFTGAVGNTWANNTSVDCFNSDFDIHNGNESGSLLIGNRAVYGPNISPDATVKAAFKVGNPGHIGGTRKITLMDNIAEGYPSPHIAFDILPPATDILVQGNRAIDCHTMFRVDYNDRGDGHADPATEARMQGLEINRLTIRGNTMERGVRFIHADGGPLKSVVGLRLIDNTAIGPVNDVTHWYIRRVDGFFASGNEVVDLVSGATEDILYFQTVDGLVMLDQTVKGGTKVLRLIDCPGAVCRGLTAPLNTSYVFLDGGGNTDMELTGFSAPGGNPRIYTSTASTGRVIAASLAKGAPVVVPSYTVATLPSVMAAGMIYVSNESGGAVLAFSDGANWRRVTDRAIVS